MAARSDPDAGQDSRTGPRRLGGVELGGFAVEWGDQKSSSAKRCSGARLQVDISELSFAKTGGHSKVIHVPFGCVIRGHSRSFAAILVIHRLVAIHAANT